MPKTVLIVDDDPHIVVGLQFLMDQNGYNVIVAEDGEAALASVKEFDPDLILLDIMLPGIDGFKVCEIIRLNPDWKDIKIIFLTAKGNEEDIARGLVLGADAYITKPYSNATVVAEVAALLK